jgi:WD40 repeat protein
LYDLKEDSIQHRLKQEAFVNRTAVATDIDRVASAGSDGYLYYWNLDTGELLYRQFAHNPIHYYVTFSPDRSILATSGSDNNLRLWEAETGELIREISGR